VGRIQQTLEGFETVDSVKFIPEKEQFDIEYRGESEMGGQFKNSISDIVIFPKTRKFLSNLGDELHN